MAGGLRFFRRAFAGSLFLLLTLYTGGAVYDLVFFDPSLLSRFQFIPAFMAGSFFIVGGILLFTMIAGRWYCSFLCPLGILQDLLGRIRKKKARRNNRTEKIIRNTILVLSFVVLSGGFSLLMLLVDPWSVYGRLTTTFILPVLTFINNQLAALFGYFGFYGVAAKDYHFSGASVVFISLLTLVFLLYCVFISGGRKWCSFLCPVGTVLSVAGRKSLLQIQFDAQKCVGCGLCEKQCKTGVISVKTKTVDIGDCVCCFNCLPVCKDDAISYGFVKRGGRNE